MGARLLRIVNPLVRKLVSAGVPTGAPNVLLTTLGRRSGKLRTVPVGTIELDGRSFVQSSYGEIGWVANLRANSEASVIHPGGHRILVQAVELSPEEGGALLRRALKQGGRGDTVKNSDSHELALKMKQLIRFAITTAWGDFAPQRRLRG